MDEETLRKTAYRIWEEQGRPQGMDFDHWLQAERERRLATKVTGSPAPFRAA
jgi:hypothetical protein